MGAVKEYLEDLESEMDQEYCDCESCQEEDRAAYEEIAFESKIAMGYI